ncbi:MAG: efflux RND transporter permease subunit, partial [Steroidobacteraceae bacterium]
QYAMRIWLDPAKLAAYGLMPADVIAAIQSQNVQVSAGEIGGLPAVADQQLDATVRARSKLTTPQQFRDIIIKHDPSGATVRLADVARVELGSEHYDNITRADGHPGSGMAVKLAPGANALATAERVRATVVGLARNLPAGYHVIYPKDSTPFIRVSIEEVVMTLFEAIGLVVLVMFAFLGSWRVTLIPAVAVPVVLLGTFGVLEVLGLSINTLTMFAMVLSIGLLVDDAIVVVENVERIMREERLSAREATQRSMREITGALIGIAASLAAVFLPMAFFGGSTGVIYRQFSVTLVTSMALSVFVALILTPALCASVLRLPPEEDRGLLVRMDRAFDRLADRYRLGIARVLKRPARWMIGYALIVAALGLLLVRLPTAFLPDEDQGEIMVQFQLPSGATISRTLDVAKQIERYFLVHERNNVAAMMDVAGANFSGGGQNTGLGFIPLKPWSERPGKANSAAAIAQRAMQALSSIRDARVFVLNPPSIQGLGQTGGFEFQLLARPGTTREQLATLRDDLIARARSDPKLADVRLGTQEDSPQLQVAIDRAKAGSLGLSMADIDSTLSTAWGGTYVDDFIDRGRIKRVYVQGDAPYRAAPQNLAEWYVRGAGGSMTPFSAFATTTWSYGPQTLSRFDGLPAYSIEGQAAPGVSSGAAMDEMASLAQSLPPGSSYAFSGLSYQERMAGSKTTELYAISLLVVFLCLAALYESWSVPLSVLLVVPLGVIGAVVATSLRGLDDNIFFQVALLTTIGLAAKNAILIVEFAEERYRAGVPLLEAALHAARLRLRPILMTSLAFVAGVLPLALSSGAGANARVAIGTGIVGGTLAATALGIFFVPLFFVLVRSGFRRMRAPQAAVESSEARPLPAAPRTAPPFDA